MSTGAAVGQISNVRESAKDAPRRSCSHIRVHRNRHRGHALLVEQSIFGLIVERSTFMVDRRGQSN
jgi:hypothetical protein